MTEKISIIVPVYNAEKTLERCVASLRGQTYENIEILLVNDGSKDGSLAMCRRFAEEDERIRVIDKPNGGVSSARNAGLDAATGTFVMFCDSDDWADSQWCGCLAEQYLPEHLIVCDFFREDIPELPHKVPTEIVKKQDYMRKTKVMCGLWNKLFLRSVLEEKHIRFPENLSLGEDWILCLNYLCAISGDVRYVYRQLYHYDISGENTLSKKTPKLSQCEACFTQVVSAMEKLGITDAGSLQTRDQLIAPHFERYLKGVARNPELSVYQKLKTAAAVRRQKGFRETCAQGILWGNPVYLWCMQHGFAELGMLYLLMVLRLKKRI